MHAIILAAGQGNRLSEFNPDARPKCLLEFGGKSLLARQLDSLFICGVHQATLVVGYEADQIIDHVGTLSSRPEIAFVYNPAYTAGSVLSYRVQITPAKRGKVNKPGTPEDDRTPAEHRAAMTWAQRLKRVFNIDVETCSECGGDVRIIASIEDPVIIQKILAHLDDNANSATSALLPDCRASPTVGLFV